MSASIEKVEYQFPEARNFGDDEDFDGQLSTTISEINVLNDCLFELVPSMQTIPLDIVCKQRIEDNEVVGTKSGTTNKEETPYLQNVQDKFPDASMTMVRKLAQLNWHRHERIRKMRDCNEEQLTLKADHPSCSLPASQAKDSGYQTMVAQSASHGVRRAPSISSFGASTNAEEVGRTRLPPPPVKLHANTKPFKCSICYQTLSNIHTKLEWR